MARNPAAQTAYGPMVLAAIEHHEPPGRRLIDDDLAAEFLPGPMRWLVRALRPAILRRWFRAAMDRSAPGLWTNLTCRKRFIDDRLDEVGHDVDAVVILGAGLDTLAYRMAQRDHIPVFEVDQPVNIARKAATVRRALGGPPPLSVRLVALDFEREDLLTTLAEHGYRTTLRTFFVWEGVTQYLTESAVHTVLEGLRAAASGSWLVFTYVRRDFIDGTNLYGSPRLYRRVCATQLWHFGLQPEEVADFLAGYGWQLIEQAGPEQLGQRYVEPTGRNLAASDLEWSVYAEKL
ncbi:MAG: SAM-dependent methyltransferase [Mycobacterium sp.]